MSSLLRDVSFDDHLFDGFSQTTSQIDTQVIPVSSKLARNKDEEMWSNLRNMWEESSSKTIKTDTDINGVTPYHLKDEDSVTAHGCANMSLKRHRKNREYTMTPAMKNMFKEVNDVMVDVLEILRSVRKQIAKLENENSIVSASRKLETEATSEIEALKSVTNSLNTVALTLQEKLMTTTKMKISRRTSESLSSFSKGLEFNFQSMKAYSCASSQEVGLAKYVFYQQTQTMSTEEERDKDSNATYPDVSTKRECRMTGRQKELVATLNSTAQNVTCLIEQKLSDLYTGLVERVQARTLEAVVDTLDRIVNEQ